MACDKQLVCQKWFTTFMYLNRGLPTKLKKKFREVFENNAFGGEISLSGRGSDLDQTKRIQEELPKLFKEFSIASIIDVPCGDQNWIPKIDLGSIKYTGADIVPELISENRSLYGKQSRSFIELDITKEIPPRADLVLCRDLLVHLNTQEIRKALLNIKLSGSEFLLTTTFTGIRKYKNLPTITRSVGWRPINLQLVPFSFPEPLRIVNEGCTEGMGLFADKSLALWRLSELNV
jgi:hypothetical protein